MRSGQPTTGAEGPRRLYGFAEFTLDLDGGFLSRGGAEIALSPKAFEVLAYLVQHHGRLVTKTALIEAVWADTAITDNSLAQRLLELRRALGDDSQQLIRTVARRGYIFTASVTNPIPEIPHPPELLPGSEATQIRAWTKARWPLAVGALAIAASTVYLMLRPRAATSSPVSDISFTRLTDQPGRETFPSLSADGRLLVYAARGAGNWDKEPG